MAEKETKEVEGIPHPDAENYPNTEWYMVTTKPYKTAPVKYEVFMRMHQVPEEICAREYGYGLTIGGLLDAGMKNISYRAQFKAKVFSKAGDPENLTDDEHRALQDTLDNYKAGVRGTPKKTQAQIKAETEAEMRNGLSKEEFDEMVAAYKKKKGKK